MAIRNPKQPDANEQVAKALRETTGTEPQGGEDLIRDPDLQRRYLELKKKLAKKKP